MATIYKLMIDGKQIGDICYNWDFMVRMGALVFIDTSEDVGIWGAEEIEGVPRDALDWGELEAPWV